MQVNKTTKSGFSLIEVIIAFSILTIAVIASTELISSSIQNNQENILRVQAYFLAQEGIELTRAYRDSVILNNEDFNTQITTGIIEFQDNPNRIEITNSSAKLYLQNGYFTHNNSDTETPFTRSIKVENLTEDQLESLNIDTNKFKTPNLELTKSAKKVSSIVEYEYGEETRTIEITTILTDWKEATK